MELDQAIASNPCEQACPTTTDWSGRPESCYGSEGWGFESLRARPGQQPIAILQRHPVPVRMQQRLERAPITLDDRGMRA